MPANKQSVILGIPVLYQGGTEEQMLSMAKCLQQDFRVSVLVYFDALPQMLERFASIGVTVTTLNLNKKASFKSTLSALKKTLQISQPDFFHVQYISPGLLPILAAKKAGIKNIFATVHQPGTPYTWRQKMMINFAALLCNRFLCVSNDVKHSWFYRMHPKGRFIQVLHNAIDKEHLNFCINSCQTKRQKKYIMYAGRLRSEKGCDLLIQAFSKPQINQDIQLLIAGDGPAAEDLKKLAIQENCQHRIEWAKHLDKPELYAAMHHAELGVVPSRFEGFGLVALEFISCGTPVIASHLPAFTEFIQDGNNGLFFEQENSEDLAQKLNHFMKNKPIKKGLALSQSVKSFEMEAYKVKLLEIYGAKS